MTAHRRKIRLNVTVDPEIFREAKIYLDAMDKTMSSLVEDSFLGIVMHLKPIKPLLNRPDVTKHELKMAMLMLASGLHETTSEQIGELLKEAAS